MVISDRYYHNSNNVQAVGGTRLSVCRCAHRGRRLPCDLGCGAASFIGCGTRLTQRRVTTSLVLEHLDVVE